MALKDILVQLDATPRAGLRLRPAVQPARRHAAHLTAPPLADAATPLFPASDPAGSAREPVARRRVRAEGQPMPAPEIDEGDAPFDAASGHAADLPVMGAEGHSRLCDPVPGRVTRGLLRPMTIPVPMAQ